MKSSVLDININLISYFETIEQIKNWAIKGENRSVFAANVHMVMEAHDIAGFCKIVNEADIVTPDGMPLVWIMILKGAKKQERVYGPTLMLHVLDMAQKKKVPVGFYGGSQVVIEALKDRMTLKYPQLITSFYQSPPFRQMSDDEDELVINQILQSGIRILFVGLGCPKQEKWITAHKGKIPAVMIGVGAAFDFHAGVKPQSPPLLQNIGLEWLFRLIHEPKRLWRRYLYNNPRFVILALADLLGLYHPK